MGGVPEVIDEVISVDMYRVVYELGYSRSRVFGESLYVATPKNNDFYWPQPRVRQNPVNGCIHNLD